MTTTVYTVRGMTCEHCVKSITQEFGALDGVTGVAVDLGVGAVTVTSDAPLDGTAVRAAVTEAGFELADAPA
jgi:copper chaperone